MKRWILYVLLIVSAVSSGYAREIYSLNSGWKFFYAEENSSDNAREIALPHTWNLDAFVGNGTYLQTSANYQRTLFVPAEWKGKRVFLRFHGVQSVADVFFTLILKRIWPLAAAVASPMFSSVVLFSFASLLVQFLL